MRVWLGRSIRFTIDVIHVMHLVVVELALLLITQCILRVFGLKHIDYLVVVILVTSITVYETYLDYLLHSDEGSFFLLASVLFVPEVFT